MPRVQEYINDRNKYKVDRTYQRPEGAWSNEDNQCFIDSLLRGEPIPIFFVNYDSSKQLYYIVDGQQRLDCISKFYDNKIKLSRKFSDENNHGKTFNRENPLDDSQKKQFLEYDLKFHILEDYDDERVRVIFSRLQRGRPLQLGERLNAKPGSIVQCMRDLADHPFLAESTAVAKHRYGVYPDAARILFYEKYKAKNCGTRELYAFFDDNRALNQSSSEFKSATRVLNYLGKCFPPKNDGPYLVFEKHAWVFAVYCMIRELQVSHSLVGLEDKTRAFVRDFHGKVYKEDFRRSSPNYQRFYDNIRGGWSEKIVALRRDTLIKEFLNKHKEVQELDDKRQISDEDKLAVFAGQCEKCKDPIKEYKDAEYHHKEFYSAGGKTTKENIMVLCCRCHDLIHRKNTLDSPAE